MLTRPKGVPNSAPTARRVTIVIPAHNEEQGLGAVLAALKAKTPPSVTEILVVDDGSTDRTSAIAEEAGVRLISHPANRGYGAALKTGIEAAQTDYVLTMDADGQHRVEDVTRLCATLEGTAEPECIIGHRTRLLHSPLWRMPGKWLLKRLAQILTRRRIPDLNCGLRLLRRDIALRYLRLCPSGFSFSTTITMALLARGYAVEFMPIEVEPRTGKSSVSVATGFDTILLVIRLATLFNPLRVFLPLSALFILVGLGWGIPYMIARQGITVAAMLLVITGVLLFALGLISDQIAQLRLERYE